MNYREKIRKAIDCPQFSGNDNYGEWGALRFEQRALIKRLLDDLDNTDECVKRLQQENQQLNLELSGYRQAILNDKEMLGLQQENEQLKDNWNELKEWLKANDIHYAEAIPFKETLRKIKELERGVSDVED